MGNNGSRDLGGNVPNANWNGKFHVNYYNPSNANDNLRSRSEVFAGRGFYFESSFPIDQFSHKLAILEISISFCSNWIYLLSLMIRISLLSRVRFFSISILIRSFFSGSCFWILVEYAASMANSKDIRQSFSIFCWMPKRSRLFICLPF